MDALNLPTSSAELKAARVAEAEDVVRRLIGKVEKAEQQLIDARLALREAGAQLAEIAAADHEYVAPTESVQAVAL